MKAELSDDQILELLQVLDEKIAHHEKQITQLMVERAKLTSHASSATQIVRAVCVVSEIPEPVLMGKRRTKEIAIARQMAMVLILERLHWTTVRTGTLFSRDHGTVCHAVHAVADRIATDPEAKQQWERINALMIAQEEKGKETA